MGLTAGPPGRVDAARLAAFAIDGMTPGAHVTARSAEDVVSALRAANETGEAVVIWGGGTRIGIGDPPTRYDVALDLRELRGVVEHEPADLTVTVRAGTTLAELAAALQPHGQRWPVEVAHPDRATVGGTLASAAGGPSRYRAFHPRDHTIGCQAVLGDGTLTRAGGRVVKNVTGYDLTRLYSGSYGTLAALVELTLKLEPIPEQTLTLRADLPDPSFAYRAVRELLRARHRLDAIAVLMGDVGDDLAPSWTALYVRIAGSGAVVARVRDAIRVGLALEPAPNEVWELVADLPADAPSSLRAAWPASEPVELYPQRAVWYPGVEVMHVLDDEILPEHALSLRRAVEGSSGAVIVESASTAFRRAVGTWGTPRLPVEIARRLRSAFDPRGVLAPGRMP